LEAPILAQISNTSDYNHARECVVQEARFGLVRVEVMGEVTAARVAFGPEGAKPMIGATVLASVGIVVDPVTQTVTRLAITPLKAGSLT